MDPQDPKQLWTVLLKLVARHERTVGLVETLALVAADHGRLLEHALPRCEADGCTDAATVRHPTFGMRRCDRHAARAIVGATLASEDVLSDGLHPLQQALGDDSMWVDLPDAVQVRRVQDWVAVMKQGEEPTAPEDKQLLH